MAERATPPPGVEERLRSLPSVDRLATAVARAELAERRAELLAGAGPGAPGGDDEADLVAGARGRLRPSLRRVLNATGVVVHTNLGRAPLSPEAAARVAQVAASYTNLEMDLAAGQRGDRESHAESRLRRILAAEATVVVNNNAAAVLLAVNTFAEGREVLVSRGELVEIGGSFRIPDVLRKGGARLREVGTTNRTRLADYRAALGPETGLILKVHPSNFRMVGFTEAPALQELVELGRSASVPVAEDLGSGLLDPLPPPLHEEPTAAASLEAGVDVVTFSGDKLLGGPQAGLAAGRRLAIDAMRKNPLYRALRVDKMTVAALDAVLAVHEAGQAALHVPVQRMLAATPGDIRRRAEALAADLRRAHPELELVVVDGASAVGGGAAPEVEVPTALLAVIHPSLGPERVAGALRAGRPAVLARVADGRLLLDLRTVLPGEEAALLEALDRACRAER